VLLATYDSLVAAAALYQNLPSGRFFCGCAFSEKQPSVM
jgi:hypothetical protein